ncbi:hypothetical protein GCM10016455_05710 [Aliiroseovarius zhejiangensis]|uniref:DUF465 domain-containing protein n=1 Tax=Aliiroseovarius zhejiangensis TaxID=1632025 RepID=A0ABQ3IM48_9RHOB|nr:hypothetical protein [Aliiroseovarius zhejiangensis]GHE88435.1 hypothetical protein GCM10016455_05710 [Aliiroseovarius zhejiangensis]
MTKAVTLPHPHLAPHVVDAQRRHEALVKRTRDHEGEPGVTALRVRTRDALHERLALELAALRAGRSGGGK